MTTLGLLSKIRLAAILSAALLTSACSAFDRLSHVGEVPELSPIENPLEQQRYKPITMPMPQPEQVVRQPNSLWAAGARTFFKDQRASKIGDILTVNIDITDSAAIDNSTTRSRSNAEGADMTNLFGVEGLASKIMPPAFDPSSLLNLGSTRSSTGSGKVDREEAISLTIAAYVTQVLPNGNLVIRGSQEVRVNYEVRELLVTGNVRPEDISNSNEINHTQIAEARISYGGRGQITDVQQPRYGQQVIDILMPF